MVTKKFIILTVTAVMLFFSGNIYSQNMNSVEFINSIADREKVNMEDAVKFFVMITKNTGGGSYQENITKLKAEGILPDDFYMEPLSTLHRGLLAKMITGKLNLQDSLLGLILPFERYAVKACIAEDIMVTDVSEWDAISGGELIEIMTSVSVILETGGTK